MTAVSVELENTLRQLDPASASSLERVVWDVLKLARQRQGARAAQGAGSSLDDKGYPAGHFDRLTGSWAGVEFELPDDPPPDPSPAWS